MEEQRRVGVNRKVPYSLRVSTMQYLASELSLLDLQMGLSGLTELDLTGFHREYPDDLRLLSSMGHHI